jgi:hypothetical protein
VAHPHRLVVLAAPALELHWLALGLPSVELVPENLQESLGFDRKYGVLGGVPQHFIAILGSKR